MISEKEFWDSRYRNRDYIYGTVPNKYFRDQIKKFNPGKILCLCEGEGRNAVYAAFSGWDVVACDFSEKAREKALELAKTRNVTIDYMLAEVEEFQIPADSFDFVALIFCHFNKEHRKRIFENIIRGLKPGGGIIFEGFSTEQLGRESGGPGDINKLYTLEEIKNLLPEFEFVELEQSEQLINEGIYHFGMANLIRFTAFKPSN